MSKLLVVFGATGQQGGSVIDYVRKDPALSSQFRIRGVVRDTTKDAAVALKNSGAEVVAADMDDPAALRTAVDGAHTVFAMTRGIYDEHSKSRELQQGKNIADAAVAAGAKYLIWSSGIHADKVSNGKYPIDAYDVRAEVEQYIRGLNISSAFVAPGCFLQNFKGMMAPKPLGDGTYAIANIHTGDTKYPWLDVVSDLGKFVGAVLAEPDKFQGKFVAAANEILSIDQITERLSKMTGKTIKYSQMPEEKYRGYLPPAGATSIVNMFLFIQHCGYFGPATEKEVAEACAAVKGHLTTVEDFFKANPPKL